MTATKKRPSATVFDFSRDSHGESEGRRALHRRGISVACNPWGCHGAERRPQADVPTITSGRHVSYCEAVFQQQAVTVTDRHQPNTRTLGLLISRLTALSIRCSVRHHRSVDACESCRSVSVCRGVSWLEGDSVASERLVEPVATDSNFVLAAILYDAGCFIISDFSLSGSARSYSSSLVLHRSSSSLSAGSGVSTVQCSESPR